MTKIIMYKKIYQDLFRKIVEGEFNKGDMLPSEMELAEQYGVSRITVNKAMGMLSEEGMVQRIPGNGTFVMQMPDKGMDDFSSEKESCKNSIGIVVDTIGAAFGEALVRGMERGCRRNGLNMLFYCTYGSKTEEAHAIKCAIAGGAKGLILMCAQGETYNSCVLDLTIKKFPVVLVDREMQGLDIPCIRTDNYTAAKEITERLIQKGHKKICFVTHITRNTSTIMKRYHGFRDCIAAYPDVQGAICELSGYNTAPESQEIEMGYDLSEVCKIIENEKECTAFFLVEYKMAVFFSRALKNMGLKREIATFDGIDTILDDQHMFLQVIQDQYQMGYEAVKLLKEKMDGREAGADSSVYIPHHIIDVNN